MSADMYANGFEVGCPDGPWSIGTMKHPRRIRRALYVAHDGVVMPVAYFRSEEDAARVEAILRMLAKGRLSE